jgi:hypothetical protein
MAFLQKLATMKSDTISSLVREGIHLLLAQHGMTPPKGLEEAEWQADQFVRSEKRRIALGA